MRDYDLLGGAENTWSLTLKPTAVNDLKTRTVEQSIEAIRTRVDSLGVSEPVIQQNGMGNNQILVQLPDVDDPGRVKDIIQSTARLELRQGFGNPEIIRKTNPDSPASRKLSQLWWRSPSGYSHASRQWRPG